MHPPILITTHALACSALIAEAMMRTPAEKETPHLVLAEAPRPDPVKMVMELQCREAWSAPIMVRQSGYERANPNQPWFAKFQQRRLRKS